jgi:hypothetical protein
MGTARGATGLAASPASCHRVVYLAQDRVDQRSLVFRLCLEHITCHAVCLQAKVQVASNDDSMPLPSTIGDECDAVVVVRVGAATTSTSEDKTRGVTSEAACAAVDSQSDCESDVGAVHLSACQSSVSLAGSSCVSGPASRSSSLPSTDGSDACCNVNSSSSSRSSSSSDCPSVASQSSPAVCSNAASVEPEAGSWGRRDLNLELPKPWRRPSIVLEVCSHDGDLRSGGDHRFTAGCFPHFGGACWYDRVEYKVKRVKEPDGSRVWDFALSAVYRAFEGPGNTADWFSLKKPCAVQAVYRLRRSKRVPQPSRGLHILAALQAADERW